MSFWIGGRIMRDSFIFYRSFYEAIKDLPRDIQGEIYTAIMEYSLYGKETDNLKHIARSIFTLIKPQIDINNKRFDNGCKGGRPKGNNQNETKDKPNDNQNETKDKPNKNYNENVNDNNIPPYNPPKGESEFMAKFSLRQKELEEWEATLRTKEQELIKIEANLKAKKKKELPDIDFVGNDFKEVFTTWLEYKRERRENYKSEKSLKLAYSKLLQLSGNDPQKAASIVEQSMANNWAGLFDLKSGNNGNRNNQNERDCRQRKFDSAVAVATRVQEAAAKRRAELKAEGVID